MTAWWRLISISLMFSIRYWTYPVSVTLWPSIVVETNRNESWYEELVVCSDDYCTVMIWSVLIALLMPPLFCPGRQFSSLLRTSVLLLSIDVVHFSDLTDGFRRPYWPGIWWWRLPCSEYCDVHLLANLSQRYCRYFWCVRCPSEYLVYWCVDGAEGRRYSSRGSDRAFERPVTERPVIRAGSRRQESSLRLTMAVWLVTMWPFWLRAAWPCYGNSYSVMPETCCAVSI